MELIPEDLKDVGIRKATSRGLTFGDNCNLVLVEASRASVQPHRHRL
jgi:hypothetical protein